VPVAARDSRRFTRPMPLTRSVTSGSPTYSMTPAPDMLACSVRSACSTTLPTPLTDTLACVAYRCSALYEPAPEMETSSLSTRPARRACSAPDPFTRSDVARRSPIDNDEPPDAAMRNDVVASFGASSLTLPVNARSSSWRNRMTMFGLPERRWPRRPLHQRRRSCARMTRRPADTSASTRAARPGASTSIDSASDWSSVMAAFPPTSIA